jgi:hypothetical protein
MQIIADTRPENPGGIPDDPLHHFIAHLGFYLTIFSGYLFRFKRLFPNSRVISSAPPFISNGFKKILIFT